MFSDCVERCIEAITFQGAFPYRLAGQPSEFSDYSFHNEVQCILSCHTAIPVYLIVVMKKCIVIARPNSFCGEYFGTFHSNRKTLSITSCIDMVITGRQSSVRVLIIVNVCLIILKEISAHTCTYHF